MCLGYISYIYNMRKFKKSNKKENEIVDEIIVKRLRLLPLYNDKYRERYYQNIARK